MEKHSSKEDFELIQQNIKDFRAIEINSLFNSYAIENVAFGDLKPGDKIPFDKFMEDLCLEAWRYDSIRNSIVGIAIAEDETVVKCDIDFFYRECFISNMNTLFGSAPQNMGRDNDENGLSPFVKDGLNSYIMRLLPLFQDILKTEAEHNFFDPALHFPDRVCEAVGYERIANFIVAILTRGLRQGRCVDRYINELFYLPYFVKKLLKMKKGRCFLANSDGESLDFQFAVLSSIRFMNTEHTELFDRKAQKLYGLISG